MRPDAKDMSRLWDMLDAARTIVEFTNGMRLDDFLNDRKTRNAVERNLEIIGEAARGISPKMRESEPGIPWRSVIGLRNVLTHEYGEVRYEVLWAIIQDKLKPLIRQLESMGVEGLPQEDE
jgi:uncharacterized protein with HEPN domain